MSDPNQTPAAAIDRLRSEQVPGDTRQARQLIRRQLITEAIMAEGSIRIEDLAERFDISLMTAHRDLDELVSRGLLRKTRGVVSAAPTSLIEASDVYRSSRQSAEKTAIARAAKDFVEPGQAIFCDDSTTVLQMAPHLVSVTPLTVITNSLTLMNELNGVRDVTLFALGGQFHNWCNAFMGRLTTSTIARLRADTLFLSMAAIIDDIVFHQSSEMVETKRAMFEAAERRILLADHTKFEHRALHSLVPMTDFDIVIVDDGIPPHHLERMRAKDINVVVAPVRQSAKSGRSCQSA